MNRGRTTSTNRGRASSKSRGNQSFRGRGRTGFFKQQTKDEEQQKLDEVTADVKDLKQYAQHRKEQSSLNTPANQRLKEKINTKIEEGKNFVNKFFQGFIQPERGNIKVELEPHVTTRLAYPYLQRIKVYGEQTFQLEKDEHKPRQLFEKFKGMVNLAVAVKLYKSSTEADKLLNHRFSSVRNVDIPMPKKLNVLINQIGKTDLMNDNRIRIVQQHLNVKRYLLRGSLWYLGSDMDQYLNNKNTCKTLLPIIENEQFFERIIDESMGSVKNIKRMGKEFFLKCAEEDRTFTIDNKDFVFRLPKFHFTEENSVEDIREYLNNAVFSSFTWDHDVVGKILASLVLQIVKYPWLKKRNKKLKTLEPEFDGTVIADYTFQDVLDYSDISFLNQYIDEDVLDDVVNDIFNNWKTAQLQHFNRIFEMDEFKFSDFGTDAQLIELQQFDYNDRDEYENRTWKLKDRQPVNTILKTSETGAVLGLSVAFSKNVKFSSKFLVQHDSKNSLILREFIKSDFRM